MGRVSDALYFLQKWNTHGNSIDSVVRRASLSAKDIKSPDRKVINVPLLALLSTAVRQTRTPLEKFFLFLLRPGEAWFEFKNLYRKVSSLKVNHQEATDLLSSFFAGKGFEIPDTRDWTRRRIALSSPFTGVRGGLIDRILSLQTKIHGDVKVVLPKITKEELANYPARIRMELVYSEVQPQKPYQTPFAFQNMQLLERAVTVSQYAFISFRNNKT